MPSESLVVAYDGPALREGSMDVRQLAPALLALGDLFERSNSILNGDKAHVSVRVSTIAKGSFLVHLEFWQTIGDHVRSLLTGDTLATADKIVGSLFTKAAGVLSVIKLIKLFKGKRIKRRSVLKNGNVEIELPDGTIGEATEDAIKLYEDSKIRENAAQTVKPLDYEGIDKVEIRRGEDAIEEIAKSEADSFKVAAEKPDYKSLEPALTSTAARAIEIVKPSFAEDLVWTVSGGEGERFTAKMADPEFNERVNRGEIFFKKGDIAIVEVATKSWFVEGRVHSEHEITHVRRFEHAGSEQLTLQNAKANPE
jgi:hypothetical protein